MKIANKIENKNTAGFQSEVLRQPQDKVARMLRIICHSETERGVIFTHCGPRAVFLENALFQTSTWANVSA